MLTTGGGSDIIYSDRGKEMTRMMDWYMDPENHAEDYEELLELLAEMAEEDE